MRSLFQCLVAAALVASVVPAAAEVHAQELAALRALDVTLALEREAAGLIRRQDGAALKRLAVDIRRTYASTLAAAPAVDEARSGVVKPPPDPCQLAGVALRRVIVGIADGRVKPRIRSDLIDAIPPDLTDQFAAHMQRCELLERAATSPRLIGSSCLIDGRRCRDSER